MSWATFSPSRGLRRLGAAGGLGLLLIAYGLGLVFLVLLPKGHDEARLAQLLHQREASLAAERQAQAERSQASPENRLAEFYQFFPAQDELLESLGSIYALAQKQGLKPEQAQYKFVAENESRLAQYEITLPLSGGYPQQRRFIEQVLAELPALELRDLAFKREGIDKENVEALLRFVLHLRAG